LPADTPLRQRSVRRAHSRGGSTCCHYFRFLTSSARTLSSRKLGFEFNPQFFERLSVAVSRRLRIPTSFDDLSHASNLGFDLELRLLLAR
jgi:hypothetical protein